MLPLRKIYSAPRTASPPVLNIMPTPPTAKWSVVQSEFPPMLDPAAYRQLQYPPSASDLKVPMSLSAYIFPQSYCQQAQFIVQQTSLHSGMISDRHL